VVRVACHERRLLEFRAEMAFLSELHHPNIALFIVTPRLHLNTQSSRPSISHLRPGTIAEPALPLILLYDEAHRLHVVDVAELGEGCLPGPASATIPAREDDVLEQIGMLPSQRFGCSRLPSRRGLRQTF
jgi:hypothetical protein